MAIAARCRRRNTPTCVGKTITMGAKPKPAQKHPHVRGEDSPVATKLAAPMETPPRAWGRLLRNCAGIRPLRNTPTCVGKTLPGGSNVTA